MGNIMKKRSALLMLLLLAGCVSPIALAMSMEEARQIRTEVENALHVKERQHVMDKKTPLSGLILFIFSRASFGKFHSNDLFAPEASTFVIYILVKAPTTATPIKTKAAL